MQHTCDAGAQLPTCLSTSLTTWDWLRAPGAAAAAAAARSAAGAAGSYRSSPVTTVSGGKKRKKRISASSWAFAEMSEEKGWHISLMGAAGAISWLCVCVSVCLVRERPEQGRKGVCVFGGGGQRVSDGNELTDWGSWFTTLPFLQNIQPESALFPRLSQPSICSRSFRKCDSALHAALLSRPSRCQAAADLQISSENSKMQPKWRRPEFLHW